MLHWQDLWAQWWNLGFIEGSEFLPDWLTVKFSRITTWGSSSSVSFKTLYEFWLSQWGYSKLHGVIYLLTWLVGCLVNHSVSWVCIMSRAVSRWAVTADVRVWSQVSLCGICGERSSSGAGFSLTALFCSVILIPPMFHALFIHLSLILYNLGSWQNLAIIQWVS